MLKTYRQAGNPAPLQAAGGRMSETADNDALTSGLRRLAEKPVADKWFDATVLPQLHVLAWGNKRGV